MVYIDNAMLGALTLPLFAILLTMPYLLFQYARFGGVSVRKTFMVLVFLFYLIVMFYQVILPLPANRSVIVAYAQTPQLDPFDVWRDLKAAALAAGLGHSHGMHGWIAFIKTPDVYKAFFNVLLTVPFGFMLRYFFKRGVVAAFFFGFALTLFFASTQLTCLWGVYALPYRLFDVCDLELNTLGSVVGSILAIPLVYLLPNLDEANEHAIERGLARVSLTRRIVGFLVDAAVSTVAAVVLFLAYNEAFLGDEIVTSSYFVYPFIVILVAATGFFFMLVPTLTNGRTLGHMLVGVRIVCLDGSKPGLANYVVRYGILVWLCMLLPFSLVVITPESVDGMKAMDLISIITGLNSLWFVTVLIRGIVSFFGKPFVMLNGYMSNTTIGTKADVRINSDQDRH